MKIYTISARLPFKTMEQIDDLKHLYAEAWNIEPNTITTTDIITWSIGITHLVKIEKKIDLTK